MVRLLAVLQAAITTALPIADLKRPTVLQVKDDHIAFETEGMEVPPNCLGAPIVNSAGEVVGMFALRGGRKGTIVAVRAEDMDSELGVTIK